jgi:hypothetical protein
VTNLPPAGWYRDPRDPDQPHYWDGQQWAELAPKPPPTPGNESLPLAELPPPTTRSPIERQKRSQVVVAGLVTLAVVALIAIGAAVQSLAGGGHSSTPTRSSAPTAGATSSPQ